MKDIHDIRPPVPAGLDPVILKAICVGLFSLCIVLALLYFIQKQRGKDKSMPSKILTPVLPPFDAAVNSLETLLKKNEIDPRLFYFDLTAIFKKYMGQTFRFNAMEMTSEQFIHHLYQLNIQPETKKQIKQFQQLSDPIKYAGSVPAQESLKTDLASVRKFIERIQDNLDQKIKEQEKNV